MSCDLSDNTLAGSAGAGGRGRKADQLDAFLPMFMATGDAVVTHGARILVMREMLIALLMQMPAPTRQSVIRSFRSGVEDVMAFTDDRELPEIYHRAFLEEVNLYLARTK